jgi:hypothetical protein
LPPIQETHVQSGSDEPGPSIPEEAFDDQGHLRTEYQSPFGLFHFPTVPMGAPRVVPVRPGSVPVRPVPGWFTVPLRGFAL